MTIFYSWCVWCNASTGVISDCGAPNQILSRYHQNRRFFMEGVGYNFRTHDFPHSWAGVKLGGFMLLNALAKGG